MSLRSRTPNGLPNIILKGPIKKTEERGGEYGQREGRSNPGKPPNIKGGPAQLFNHTFFQHDLRSHILLTLGPFPTSRRTSEEL